MLLRGASVLYSAAATWRRRWYARRPTRQRSLEQPVVSVGNLSTGGRGKSPVVAALARLLTSRGERPAILSRGYGRRRQPDGVTVVSDGSHVLADVESAGDEPLMLARALPHVPVLVASDRHLAGRMAETRFGATVHVLDDGFQHVALARDVDLVLIDDADLEDRVLPAGRLREPLEALRTAGAILTAADSTAAGSVQHLAPGVPMFGVRRSLGTPEWVGSPAGTLHKHETRVFAAAAVARPDRFFADLAAAGWNVTGAMAFRDHHWFDAADIAKIESAASAANAEAIVTTDKDAVRLEMHRLWLPVARIPLNVSIEPAEFDDWLMDRVREARLKPEA
ncbi:MAG: tetraacyldisaccharide 4'-kinase [Vicinamibacterales bacterium]